MVKKQEMTKIWIGDQFVPVTLVKVVPQEIVRYKTKEKDGYVAAVVGTEKKEVDAKKGKKIEYAMSAEFDVDEQFIGQHAIGSVLDQSLVEGVEKVSIMGYAIGKGFQGMVKKWHVKGMGATHGHKFTRTGWSKGNRKPRRTMKGHPHAGHMGTQRVTIKEVKILDKMISEKEQILVLKGSLPGAYNGMLKLAIQ